MNKKDYREIAGIIKDFTTCTYKKDLVNNLSDYFEKEDPIVYWGKEKHPEGFNRKQFLKDCGAE